MPRTTGNLFERHHTHRRVSPGAYSNGVHKNVSKMLLAVLGTNTNVTTLRAGDQNGTHSQRQTALKPQPHKVHGMPAQRSQLHAHCLAVTAVVNHMRVPPISIFEQLPTDQTDSHDSKENDWPGRADYEAAV
eukprot:964009-Prymnesium_polylepis.2